MDDNPYTAPQTEHKRPLGKLIPTRNPGAIVGAVIGGLLVPVWCAVVAVYSGSWLMVAPEPTDLVLVSAWFSLLGGCIGFFIGAAAQSP